MFFIYIFLISLFGDSYLYVGMHNIVLFLCLPVLVSVILCWIIFTSISSNLMILSSAISKMMLNPCIDIFILIIIHFVPEHYSIILCIFPLVLKYFSFSYLKIIKLVLKVFVCPPGVRVYWLFCSFCWLLLSRALRPPSYGKEATDLL